MALKGSLALKYTCTDGLYSVQVLREQIIEPEPCVSYHAYYVNMIQFQLNILAVS